MIRFETLGLIQHIAIMPAGCDHRHQQLGRARRNSSCGMRSSLPQIDINEVAHSPLVFGQRKSRPSAGNLD